ncbi:hypothetical protein NX059_007604 [Plenodomus lindquistii]|nr:hypothetical protein NX059_007604 [Plenodomus lindquistii]
MDTVNELQRLRALVATGTYQRDDINLRVIDLESANILERLERLELANKGHLEREKTLIEGFRQLQQENAEQAAEINRLKRAVEQGRRTDTAATAISLRTDFKFPKLSENASYLPFALEDIVYQFETRKPSGRTCAAKGCGQVWPTVHCFQKAHFKWCGAHHLAVGYDRTSCAKNGKGSNGPCTIVHWVTQIEIVETLTSEAWTELVGYSSRSGLLGHRGVPTLDIILSTAKTLD